MREITFTLDLEDSRDDPALSPRFVPAARALLPFLAERGIRGTIFVVGELVELEASLIRDFAAAGHEIALHGWRHEPLPELDPATLAADLRRGQAALEDLVGRPVTGFRAPYFSLTRDTTWAVDVLGEAGFAYSSSVLPARNPLYGFPECPRVPFRWANGLLELPVPVAGLFGIGGLPFLGGVYLRVLPRPAVAALRAGFGRRLLQWTYCHPYDFDAEEPFRVVTGHSRLESRLLWRNRDRMLGRLDRLLRGRAGPPLGERVAAGIPVTAAAPSLRAMGNRGARRAKRA